MIDVEKYAAYYWLSRITKGRQSLQEDMKNAFGGITGVWKAADLCEIDYGSFIGGKGVENGEAKALMKEAVLLMKKVSALGIGVLSTDDVCYPALLREHGNRPALIYFEGKIEKINKCRTRLSVVGSRKCTSYGREVCMKLVSSLSEKNVCIVSGLARGIDSFAHKASVESGIFTAAVLGCGTDVIYPAENAGLYNKIKETGVIISEQPPGTQPLKNFFPARNRIIAGISEATLVVEAGLSSGALITANFALDAGRDVLTVPHRIDTPEGAGCNDLLKSGAVCITSPYDVLTALGFDPEKGTENADVLPEALGENQKEIYSIIKRNGEMFEDEIASETDISSQEIKRALSALEIFGFIKKDLGGRFYAV